jgi:AraC-like DNA-binding protein
MEYKEILDAIPFLVNSDLSVKEITNEIGFKDTRYFSRLFKGLTGKTPMRFRREELTKKGLAYSEFISGNFVCKARKVIEKNISDSSFDIERLAYFMHVSKATLYRKVKNGTGLSPSELIRSTRLRMSVDILKTESIASISDLAFEVGYNDPKYFSRCFRHKYGHTPNSIINPC